MNKFKNRSRYKNKSSKYGLEAEFICFGKLLWKNMDSYYRCKCGQGQIIYHNGYKELKDHPYGK